MIWAKSLIYFVLVRKHNTCRRRQSPPSCWNCSLSSEDGQKGDAPCFSGQRKQSGPVWTELDFYFILVMWDQLQVEMGTDFKTNGQFTNSYSYKSITLNKYESMIFSHFDPLIYCAIKCPAKHLETPKLQGSSPDTPLQSNLSLAKIGCPQASWSRAISWFCGCITQYIWNLIFTKHGGL